MSPVVQGEWNCVAEGKREACIDGPARRAQTILDELGELERAWVGRNGPLPKEIPPLRVMIYRSKGEFQPFQLISTNLGLFQSGAGLNWLMVYDAGEGALRAARHEWVHLAQHHTSPALPLWLEEGLAEYWSTLEVSGGQARLGKPANDHIRLLNQARWLTAGELLGVDRRSEFYRDERLAGIFYAQSWAMVHMLGQSREWRGKLEAYAATVGLGGDARDVFSQMWGRSFEQAVDAARSWVRMGAPGTEAISLAPAGDTGERRTRTLDATEARILRADALLAHNMTADAQVLIEEAARRAPGRADVAAARGFVALQRGDKPAALKLFEAAISLGERRGAVLLERAMLMRETGASAAKVRAALKEAVESSRALAEGWHLLSNMAAAEGDKAEAIRTAEMAAAILPRQSIFWEPLGRAYLAAGRALEAANAANKALLAARNDNELKLAEGLKKDAAAWRPQEPPKAQGSWYQIPDGWQGPKPDTGISGRLVEVACGTNSLLFTVETAPKQRTVLRAADPSRIFLKQEGGEKREFVCGAQKPVLLVEAGYRAAPDRASKTAGELIVLAIQGVETPPPAPSRAAKKKLTPSKKAPAKKR